QPARPACSAVRVARAARSAPKVGCDDAPHGPIGARPLCTYPNRVQDTRKHTCSWRLGELACESQSAILKSEMAGRKAFELKENGMTEIARRKFLKGVGVAGLGATATAVAAPAIAQSTPE